MRWNLFSTLYKFSYSVTANRFTNISKRQGECLVLCIRMSKTLCVNQRRMFAWQSVHLQYSLSKCSHHTDIHVSIYYEYWTSASTQWRGLKKIRRESFEILDDIMLTQGSKIHLIFIKEHIKKNKYECERKIKNWPNVEGSAATKAIIVPAVYGTRLS